MKSIKLTPKKKKQLNMYVRLAIQILFFLLFPSTFTSAFNGVKYIFTQIGLGSSVALNSFLAVLIALCVYTIVFGRFFCGYACAFGTMGDLLHKLYLFICKKMKKKPFKLNDKLSKALSYLKYVVLLFIVIMYFLAYSSYLQGKSPWDVFSMIVSFNFRFDGYTVGIIALVVIMVGMFFIKRFFCRFLCPMGAVFSLLPSLPFTAVTRKRENCIKGCKACKNICPANIDIPERGKWNVSGECFQCGECISVCPKQNTGISEKVRGNEIWYVLLRAVILLVVLYFIGV